MTAPAGRAAWRWRRLGPDAAQAFNGPRDVFGRGVSLSGLAVCSYAFLHAFLWLYSTTAMTIPEFQALWTSPAVSGATVWDVSAMATIALGILLVVEAWGETALRSAGWLHRLAGILFSLMLVGSLGMYLRSVTAVLEHFMGGGSHDR